MMKSSGNIVVVTKKTNEYVCDVNGKASKVRTGTHSPVVFSIFEYYAGYGRSIGENYWYELFTNASKGTFPSKIYKVIDSSILVAKINTSNVQQFQLTPPQRENIPYYYEKCKEFISNTSGAASKDDVYSEVNSSRYEPEPWTGSIPPSRQVAMIDIFVNRKSREFFLSDEKREELKESLIGKIFLGELKSKIIKTGHTIDHIEGLYFQPGNFFIQTEPVRVSNLTKKKCVTSYHEEEEVDEFIFKCSKNISASLKNRLNKGFTIDRFQIA